MILLHTLLLLFTSLICAQVPEGDCNGPIKTIATRPDSLYSFSAGPDGQIYFQFWRSGWTAFTDWTLFPNVTVPPCSPVNAISLYQDQYDLFVTDTDGKIVTTSVIEAQGVLQSEWIQISQGTAEPGSPVEVATTRGDSSTLHLFVVGTDSSVWTVSGETGAGNDTTYDAWQKVGTNLDDGVPLGAPVHAASKAEDELDIFVTGKDGKVYTAHWGGCDWEDFEWLNQGLAAPGAPVSVISKYEGELDTFVVGTDGNIWSSLFKINGWGQWRSLTTGQQLQPTQSIGVASKATGEIDYAFVGSDNRVYSGHWNRWTDWIGPWWINEAEIDIAGTPVEAGPHVEAFSRADGFLDLFLWGINTQGYGAYTAHYGVGNDGWCGFSLTTHEAGYCPL